MTTPRTTRRQFLGHVSAAAAAAALTLAPKWGRAADAPAGTSAAPAPGKKLGVALVGLGSYSNGQLGPGLTHTQYCHLTGVVTGDAAKGKRWAQKYGFPEKNIYSYDTMAGLADNPDIDIVYVVTPNALHARHCIAAAKAGKHVICEKPMAVSVAECDSIIAACAAAKVRLSVGYRLHFDPFHEELRRLARTKEFGPFRKMHGQFAFVMGTPQWRATHQLAGGGPLMDLGVYVIQESCMAANEATPVAVTARERPKRRPEFFVDVEEALDFTLEFADGAHSECFTSYNDSGDDFHADADGGWIEYRPAYIYDHLKGRTSQGPIQATPPVSQQTLQMDDFAQCILTGRPTPVGGDMGRRDLAIIEAIYRSVKSGQREAVQV